MTVFSLYCCVPVGVECAMNVGYASASASAAAGGGVSVGCTYMYRAEQNLRKADLQWSMVPTNEKNSTRKRPG